jgi:hypothetical protein
MIAMTTSNSISVKPVALAAAARARQVVPVKNRFMGAMMSLDVAGF